MDPEVKLYFRKIITSFSIGLLWMFIAVTAGLYFKLAIVEVAIHWYNWLFYVMFCISLLFLLRFYYNLWKDPL
jgi:hypothetical protein